MKKIAVISDTHIPVNAKKLPDMIFKSLKGVDMILHAGDVVELGVLTELSAIAPIKVVAGNMDSFEIRQQYPVKDVIELEGHKIGLIHGKGFGNGLFNYITGEFKPDCRQASKVDAIIFGHSHIAINKIVNGVLYFNPGTVTDKIFAPYNSYGMLYINEKGIKGEIIKIS